MTPEQNEIFQAYCALGADRNLEDLHKSLGRPDISLRQLRRMSAKFRWQDLARKVQDNVVDEITGALTPVIESMTQEQIIGLHTIQRRFLERLNLEPEAEGAFNPDFEDFERAVKLERLILGDPTERKETVTPESRIFQSLPKADLQRLAVEAIRGKYGAPNVKVTVREDDLEGMIWKAR
jgi:hypothetical protein